MSEQLKKQTIGRYFDGEGGRVTDKGDVVYSPKIVGAKVTIAAGAANIEFVEPLTVANIRTFMFDCDGPIDGVTIKFNSSSVPDKTITAMKPNNPSIWSKNDPIPNPLALNDDGETAITTITGFFVTNLSATTLTTFKYEIGYNNTPGVSESDPA